MNPRYHNLTAIQKDLKAGVLSCSELVQYYLNRAEQTKELNAYVELYSDEALKSALEMDQLLKENPQSLPPCFGLVISVKDLICQKDKQVCGASQILQGFTAQYSATALQRLIQAGAIVIGRTNCDQFGMGSSNENSIYGPVLNADDPTRIAGGSSGGSAVSVQTDSCLLALGSDTGGSVRQPAGFCGLFALKPTYGRISRHGLLAYASSFDQIGFIGRSPEDLAKALEICAGPDEFDASMLTQPAPKFNRPFSPLKHKKIAYIDSAINHPAIDPEIKSAHLELLEKMKKEGYDCQPVPLDLLEYIVPTYYTLTTAEASANLSRYDGIRYGQREAGNSLEETYTKSRSQGFSAEVKRRILLGTFVLSAGYYDAYYGKAQKIRRLLQQEMERILAEYEAIILPVSPIPAWKVGEKNDDPTKMYLGDIFTVLANLVGLPALSIPLIGHTNGTMFATQVITSSLQEEKLLFLAEQLKPRHH